jgi:ABC-type Na+ efflux pump permease subunit
MLSIILTGAALIREREHGTIEHLLVMPVTPFEIMASKIWSMGLVVLIAAAVSLVLVVQGLLACRSRARSRCSCSAPPSSSSPPPRWASSSPPSRDRCRSSACC